MTFDMETTSALPHRQPLFVAQPPARSQKGALSITSVLVANRGEIACRIIATCKKLNISTVAIYVEEDSFSRHITLADQSISLGSLDQDGGNPYLNSQKLVEVALRARADAVHPGYGYLSENAAFADVVRQAGLVFVGPSSTAMSTLGDKRTAKDYLRSEDPSIALIPGFDGSSQDLAELERAAKQIGFPVMLKASAGGGGRGMRIVRHEADLRAELQSAQSEAVRSFGSSDCILEKYIEAGKHIEIQIVGDSYGNVVSLHERECSIQRRHQKVIEETPSPWITLQKREDMSKAAVRIGKLLRYENAGTIEFVVDTVSSKFYFLEVNTRLQVEHPVTEEVTGLDIVSLQLFVAAGGSLNDLPVLSNVPQQGHAIECRLCAEDPKREFYPERGCIRLWRPADVTDLGISNVRFETAMRTGGEVSIHFDSMIAKIIVWAPTRSLAVRNMARVLANTACVGVRTNQQFLQSCLLHPGFQDPSYTTSFIAQNLPQLLLNPYADHITETQIMMSLVPCLFVRNTGETNDQARARPFRNVSRAYRNQLFDAVNVHADIVTSPLMQPLMITWLYSRQHGGIDSVQVSSVPPEPQSAQDNSKHRSVALEVTARYNAISNAIRNDHAKRTLLTVKLDKIETKAMNSPGMEPWLCADIVATIDGTSYRATLATIGSMVLARSTMQGGQPISLMCHFPSLGDWLEFKVYSFLAFCESLRQTAASDSSDAMKQAIAPMPCKIIAVLKQEGDEVKAGEPIVAVESMKMEMNISIPTAGKLRIKIKVGEAVGEGALLYEVV